MGLGIFGFLGGTVLLPLSVQKPIELGFMGTLATILWAVQCFTALAVIAEWPLTKKPYVTLLTVLLVASLVLGIGDLFNAAIFGFIGGLMVFVRILSTISLCVALYVGSALKRIPLD